jgi:prepilin-type N-terminal cleavage/methylation domain-containing protein
LDSVKNQKGFSLIEILAAMSILSIITVSLLAYFLQGIDISENQHQRVIASQYAKMKINELRDHFKVTGNYSKLHHYVYQQSDLIILFNDHTSIKNNWTIADIPSQDMRAALLNRLNSTQLDSSNYRYLLEIDRTTSEDRNGDGVDEQTRKGKLDDLNQVDISTSFLKARLIVYWSSSENLIPVAKDSVSVDFYITAR